MPEENVNEFTHKQRRIEIREGPHTFELSINGYPLKVSRLDDGSYHSSILTHQSFDSAEEMARALAEVEGTLWVAGPGTIGHGHSGQTPHEPHEDEHDHEH